MPAKVNVLVRLSVAWVGIAWLRGDLKKNYKTLDIVQTSADPPPLGRYGRKKFGRSDLARTPPLPLP